MRDREHHGGKNAEDLKKGEETGGFFALSLPPPLLFFPAHFSLRQLDSNVKVFLFFFLFFVFLCFSCPCVCCFVPSSIMTCNHCNAGLDNKCKQRFIN